MVRACILIRVVPKRARDVFNDIRMIGGVKKVMMVYGRFDVVALLEMDDIDGIVNITKKINSIEGARRTETLVEA